MTEQYSTVQPPLEYIAPNFKPWVYFCVKPLANLYRKLVLGIKNFDVEGADIYIDQYRRFLNGETRMAVAFRHPTPTDPQAVWFLAARAIPSLARKAGVKLPRMSNVHFLYGRGVPLWAGRFVKWLLPRIGALQLYHRKMDAQGMRTIREVYAKGRFPLAMAPEGQVSYHNYHVAELEQGVARMGLWCLEDLRRMDSDQDVVILPVALIYDYTSSDPDKQLDSILFTCEKLCGFPDPETAGYRDRIFLLLEHITATLEEYYSRFFSADLPTTEDLQGRIEAVVEVAMETAERLYRIDGRGEIIPRIFTARQAFWDDIFREDVDDIKSLCSVDRSIADRIAATSYYASRHLELVDNLVYIDVSYIDPPASQNRLIEMALNIHGVIGRMMGGDISSRILARNNLTYRIGKPISIKAYADSPRKGRKRQVGEITDELYKRLEALSVE